MEKTFFNHAIQKFLITIILILLAMAPITFVVIITLKNYIPLVYQEQLTHSILIHNTIHRDRKQ